MNNLFANKFPVILHQIVRWKWLLSDIPLHFSLYTKPSCHSLSKALEISNNTARVSSYFFKGFKNLRRNGPNPDWFLDNKLCV